MGNVTILFGIAFVTFILVYMFFKLSETLNSQRSKGHFLLQLLILFLILSSIMLMGKVSLDDKDFCSWNVVNSTTTSDTTSYAYEYQCETNTSATPNIFYRLTAWFFYIVSIYIFIYFIYEVLKFLGWVAGGKK